MQRLRQMHKSLCYGSDHDDKLRRPGNEAVFRTKTGNQRIRKGSGNMGKIRSTDEPVGRMAKLMAELYYFMAREFIERLGEEAGREAIRSAVTGFGEARAKVMREEAKERGLEINAETYAIVRDMPGISWEKDPANPADITYCPMHDMWDQLDALEIGALYCEIDSILYHGFQVDFERPFCKTSGDSCCRFVIHDKNK